MRRSRIVVCAVLVVTALGASACSQVADTTSLSADDVQANTAVPTTAMSVGQLPTSTTTTSTTLATATLAPTGLTSTLSALVGRFAADPALATRLGGLDLAGLAGLVNIDAGAIAGLGLSVPQIQQLAGSVAADPAALLGQLQVGEIDPNALLALLAGSLDLTTLAAGATGALVTALLEAVSDMKISISPDLTIELSELLKDIDPEGLGQLAATPTNASILALITSAIISSNPLLTQQLLDNPLLDPALQGLLVQLQLLGASLGDAAKIALLQALNDLIPGGIPGGMPPGFPAA
ncbi:MAG: hypothetical protein ACYC2O_02460 [Microthrixaceae bacterium]